MFMSNGNHGDNMTNETAYIVTANNAGSTPAEMLYGDEQRVFADRADAESMRDYFASMNCWGRDGNLTAEQVGIEYVVEEADEDDIDR